MKTSSEALSIKEKNINSLPGLIYVGVAIPGIILLIWLATRSDGGNIALTLIWGIAGLLFFGLFGLYSVNPNEAKVLLFFGNYRGTVKTPGLKWNCPLYRRLEVSMKVRNFESTKLKVNDHDGNPIEIASIIVWKVVDTAEVLFQIDDFEKYVHVQTESAIRNLAMKYPYDSHAPGNISLHGSPDIVIDQLKNEVQARLHEVGVEIIEARLSHLAYAPEIAATMLQRQQASAIIGARQKIVEGAVGMVEMALKKLAENQIVVLDDERKAAMVSNLLVVLCGERAVQPIINAGSIY